MTLYRYEAMDNTGAEIVDDLEAIDEAHAQQLIRERGYFVTKIGISHSRNKSARNLPATGSRNSIDRVPPKDPVSIIDIIITLIRIPLCLTAIALITCSHAIHFCIETIVALIWLPIAATVQSRGELRNSWLANYPNILRQGYNYHASLPNSSYQGLFSFLFESGLKLFWWALFPPKGCFQSIRTAITWVGRD